MEGQIVYRLNFEIGFKKPAEQMDVKNRISDIEALAKTYSSDPSSENAEALAKESVNAEKAFWSYFEQSGKKCTDVMDGIFGSETKKREQSIISQQYTFCSGDNFEVIARARNV